jgi:hypothetical protein
MAAPSTHGGARARSRAARPAAAAQRVGMGVRMVGAFWRRIGGLESFSESGHLSVDCQKAMDA